MEVELGTIQRILTTTAPFAFERKPSQPRVTGGCRKFLEMVVDETTLRLLTVLNAVSSKRPLDDLEISSSERPAKLNRKKVATVDENTKNPRTAELVSGTEGLPDELNYAFTVEKAEDGEATECKLLSVCYHRATAQPKLQPPPIP